MTDKQYIKKLEDALYDSLALNINWVSTALYSDLEFHSEYEEVIKHALHIDVARRFRYRLQILASTQIAPDFAKFHAGAESLL